MDRDFLVFRAKLAELAERFDEMVTDIREVAEQQKELTKEERNLLIIGEKFVWLEGCLCCALPFLLLVTGNWCARRLRREFTFRWA